MDPTPWDQSVPFRTTLFLTGAQNNLSLFVYDQGVNRFAFFRHFISQGLASEARVIYAYYSTNLVSQFKNEIDERKVLLCELRHGINDLKSMIVGQQGKTSRIHIIVDFSRRDELPGMLDLLEFLKNGTRFSASLSGVVAFNLQVIDDEFLREVAGICPSALFVSDDVKLLSFPEIGRNISEITRIIPQDVIDSVVKHSLEPLILMRLDKPVSGFDILKDITERFHVDIPLARVYSYLYNLEADGLVTTETHGRSKMYVPTSEGVIFIRRRLANLQAAHNYVLGYQEINPP